jgi:hypothetical protein
MYHGVERPVLYVPLLPDEKEPAPMWLLRAVSAFIFALAIAMPKAQASDEPIPIRQGNGTGQMKTYVPPEGVPAPLPGVTAAPRTAVGGGTNGNLTAVNAAMSGVGLYLGLEFSGWNDTQRKAAINNVSNWGFAFLSPKIADEGGNTWYSSTTQLDNWILWCSQAGIKFFPFTYVDPDTGGTGTTTATNRAAAIAAEIAQHNGIVLVDMEAEWQSSSDAYGPNMTAFGTAYRSAAPNLPIVVTGFGDPTSVLGSSWPYAEMKSFADAYAPQWYFSWWNWYLNTKGTAGVKNAIDTCYNQCKTYFGSTYPMVPNGSWTVSDGSTGSIALPDLYAATAYMKKFNAPIIWWEYKNMTRAIASAIVGYGYFTDQPVPTGSPSRPAAIVTSASSVAGGTQVTFTVNLGGPAPPGGQAIGLSSSNSSVLPVPATITAVRGSTSASVTVTAGSVSADTQVTLTATNTATGATVSTAKSITVTPGYNPLTNLTLDPGNVVAGQTSTGTVTLSGPAPAGGETISLSSDNAAIVVPAGGVTVQAGGTAARFTISTDPLIGATVFGNVTASFGQVSFKAPLIVNANGVEGLVLDKPAIHAGATATGTVTLLGDAPSGGLNVTVYADDPTVASVVSPVPIAAGSKTGTFTITGQPVAVESSANITATLNGIPLTTVITVQPWHDVNGDGAFDVQDVVAALRIAAGLDTPAPASLAAADMDGSGTVDILDAVALLRMLSAL